MRTSTRLVSGIAILGALVVLWSPQHGPGKAGGNEAAVVPLTVGRVPTRPLKVSGYPGLITAAVYPRVSGPAQLQAVNRALRNAVVGAEGGFGRFLRSFKSQEPKILRQTYHGGFEVSVSRSLLSASTVVVSALMPLNECLPGCTNVWSWLSITVRVPSAEPVTLPELFANPRAGMVALARNAAHQVVAENKCVHSEAALYRPLLGGDFSPTFKHYQYFALTSSGIAVGFPVGGIAAPPCGLISTIVSYRHLTPYLSHLGRELLAGVRAAR